MFRTTTRLRKAGVSALVAATALSSLAFTAPSASAAPVGGTLNLDAPLGQTFIGLNAANQAVSPLRISGPAATDTATAGDTFLIQVSDNGGSICLNPTDVVSFSALPTVTVTGTATVAAAITESTTCGLLAGAPVNDVLAITVTGSGTLSAINISGITYTVGATADQGAVQVNGAFDSVVPGPPVPFSDTDAPDASNAVITDSLFTANVPPKGATWSSGGSYGLSSLVIREAIATSGAGEFKDQIANGDIRVLATSGEKAVEGIDAPSLKEAGIDLVFTNWRGVVAPPGISDKEQDRLIGVFEKMHETQEWKDALEANSWADAFETGDEFGTFLKEQDKQVADTLGKLGLA